MTLFSQPLLTVNPLEMMKLWGELVECYHGVNGYGSDTAEIYAYRLMPYNPIVHRELTGTDLERETIETVCATAANALVSLCEEFANQYDCIVRIDDTPLEKWLVLSVQHYDHRCHVKVIHK